LIVVAVLLGVLVLRDSGGSGFRSSAAVRDAIENFTTTTLPLDDEITPTTLAAERPANLVKVVAINASGKSGEATRATTKLQSAGYNALQAGNATQAVTNSKPAALVYVVTAGYEREARTIAALFSLPDSAVRALPSPSPSPDIKGDVNIAVLVGTGITI
jgi:hypothetical protein